MEMPPVELGMGTVDAALDFLAETPIEDLLTAAAAATVFDDGPMLPTQAAVDLTEMSIPSEISAVVLHCEDATASSFMSRVAGADPTSSISVLQCNLPWFDKLWAKRFKWARRYIVGKYPTRDVRSSQRSESSHAEMAAFVTRQTTLLELFDWLQLRKDRKIMNRNRAINSAPRCNTHDGSPIYTPKLNAALTAFASKKAIDQMNLARR
jgi:hypothetical protein